jgi:hypothetical protein
VPLTPKPVKKLCRETRFRYLKAVAKIISIMGYRFKSKNKFFAHQPDSSLYTYFIKAFIKLILLDAERQEEAYEKNNRPINGYKLAVTTSSGCLMHSECRSAERISSVAAVTLANPRINNT